MPNHNIAFDLEQPVALGISKSFLMALVSCLLFFSGIFVWLTPLPLIYLFKYSKKYDGWLAVMAAIAFLVFLYLFLFPQLASQVGPEKAEQILFWLPGIGIQPLESIWRSMLFGGSYYLVFVTMAILLGRYESRGYSFPRVLLQITGIIAGVLWMGLLLWTAGNFRRLVQGLEGYFSQLFQQVLQSDASQDSAAREQIGLLQGHMKTLVYYLVRLVPGMALNFCLFTLWLNVQVGRRMFFKAGWYAKTGGFSQWSLPFLFVWTLIGCSLLLLADVYWLNTGYFKIFALNAFLVFSLLYFLQGLAIASYYMQKWIISPFLRLACYLILFLFFQPVSLLLMTFGFFDSWFDFRKLVPKPAGS